MKNSKRQLKHLKKASFSSEELTVEKDSLEEGESSGATSRTSVDVVYKRDLYWGTKQRPTHFFTFRLDCSNLLANVGRLHERILRLEPRYSECLIPVERLHLTLCNVRLPCNDISQVNDELVKVESNTSAETVQPSEGNLTSTGSTLNERLRIALQTLSAELNCNENKLNLTLDGIGQFSNTTLYAKVKDETKQLYSWVERLVQLLKREGFHELEVFEFNPHVTLLKIARWQAAKFRCRYIDGRVLADMEEVGLIGNQEVSELYLCEKSSKFDESTGFYSTVATIRLTDQKLNRLTGTSS